MYIILPFVYEKERLKVSFFADNMQNKVQPLPLTEGKSQKAPRESGK